VPAAEREELEQALREITPHKSKKRPPAVVAGLIIVVAGFIIKEEYAVEIDAERIVETGLLARLLDRDHFTRVGLRCVLLRRRITHQDSRQASLERSQCAHAAQPEVRGIKMPGHRPLSRKIVDRTTREFFPPCDAWRFP
jgi:hypothetical protein